MPTLHLAVVHNTIVAQDEVFGYCSIPLAAALQANTWVGWVPLIKASEEHTGDPELQLRLRWVGIENSATDSAVLDSGDVSTADAARAPLERFLRQEVIAAKLRHARSQSSEEGRRELLVHRMWI